MVSEPSGRGGERPFTQTDSSGRAEARPSEASAATTVYFVAGECSGDDHGAALLKALRARVPEMRFAGRGGPKMRALAGAKFPELTIIYYISPQVWAWNRRRVSQMAQSIDLTLCIFPFEPELYKATGLRAIFVGHPMTSVIPSEVEGSRGETSKSTSTAVSPLRDDKLVGLFPGSREREVKKIFA